VHGCTLAEAHNKTMEQLQQDISLAYEVYESNHFIISHHLSSLFDKPLSDLLKMDQDYQQCSFLMYEEAVINQQNF
jgi:hypothetical protein